MLTALWAKAQYLLDHPTMVSAFLQVVLAAAISQGLFNLTPEQTGIVTAAVAAVLGLIAACLTTTGLLTAILGLLQAAAAFFAGFALPFNTTEISGVIATAIVAIGFVQHSKTSPKLGPLAAQRAVASVAPRPPVEVVIHHDHPAAPSTAPDLTKPGAYDQGGITPSSIPIAKAVTRPATVEPATPAEPDAHCPAPAGQV